MNPFAKAFKTPSAWIGTWQTVSSGLSACVWLFLIAASGGLLMLKPWSVAALYGATGIGIALAGIKSAVLVSYMGMFGLPMSFGVVPGLVINVVLLLVVAAADKTVFAAATTRSRTTLMTRPGTTPKDIGRPNIPI